MRTPDLCLINPPRPDLVNPHAQTPVGLLYLAAVVQREGYDVMLANFCGLAHITPDDIPWARVYGITGTYLDIPAVNETARAIREAFPRARILVGGPIALSADELCGEIDTVVTGEGEDVIVDLLLLPEAIGPTRIIGAPVADLDSLPLPWREGWPGPFGGTVFLGGTNYFGGGSATLLTSRGCPFSCAFCAGPSLTSRKVRFHSAGRVVEEMERLVRDFGVRQFRLSDEHLTAGRTHALEVCAGIRASKILNYGAGIAWRASICLNPHDRELYETLLSAGCREISLGVESADPEALAILTKKASTQDALDALANARDVGLKTRALLMVGTPGERPETYAYNAAFIDAAPYDAVAITVFTPVPGCAVAQDPARFGCKIIEASRSLCLYGPDGKNAIAPTIEIAGMTIDEHAKQMYDTIALAEDTGRLGSG